MKVLNEKKNLYLSKDVLRDDIRFVHDSTNSGAEQFNNIVLRAVQTYGMHYTVLSLAKNTLMTPWTIPIE